MPMIVWVVLFGVSMVLFLGSVGVFIYRTVRYPGRKGAILTVENVVGAVSLVCVMGLLITGIPDDENLNLDQQLWGEAYAARSFLPEGSVLAQGKNDNVICYNRDEKSFSYRFSPSGMKTGEPTEVGFLVVFFVHKSVVGKYDDGSPAYRQSYNLTLIDTRTWETVGNKIFQGGPPPEKANRRAEGIGKPPDTDVMIHWVQTQIAEYIG